MQLFEYLGMHVRLETKILYYRKGEYKSIRDLLRWWANIYLHAFSHV